MMQSTHNKKQEIKMGKILLHHFCNKNVNSSIKKIHVSDGKSYVLRTY